MLKSWLAPYLQTTEKTYTHLLLNGGKYNIPNDKEREFIEVYSKCLYEKERLYVVEHRPPLFKYMIDIDLKEPVSESNQDAWSKEKIIELVQFIQQVVYEFYEIDMNVICLSCNTKEIFLKKKNKYIKVGIHLVWPRHFINSGDAILLREGILQKLLEKYGERYEENKWADVIDERIYTSNGFRMVGSDKLAKKTAESVRAHDNSTDRIVPENRIYWPLFVMDSMGELRNDYFTRICKDMEALVLDTSIRFVPVSIGTPITKIPTWLTIEERTRNKIKRNKTSSKISRLDIETKEFDTLREIMLQKLPKEYSNQQIKSVQRYPDGNLLIITDSRHCMNIGREHNSCGIYFFASNKGIYQKCLCPCINMKDRIFGYCKDYTSSCFEFPEDVRNVLFPKTGIRQKNESKKKIDKINLSGTQSNHKFCKHLSSFCDDIFNSI